LVLIAAGWCHADRHYQLAVYAAHVATAKLTGDIPKPQPDETPRKTP